MKHLTFWEATATLVGTIIGAGIFGLPYVIAQTGIIPGFLMLLLLGLAALVINMMFAEVVLRTRFRHQVAGYAKKYLGRIAYFFEIAAIFIGSFGALAVYLIGIGQAMSALFGGNSWQYSLLFYVFGIIVLYFGLRIIKVFELWMVLIFVILILIIASASSLKLDFSNWQYVDWQKIFIPYGVILFAYGGKAAIVPLREILRKDSAKVKKAVLTASFIPLIIYIIFSLLTVGVTGLNTTEVATVGLGQAVGPFMLIFGNLFALFAMATSFLAVSLVAEEVLMFDLKFSKLFAWLTVALIPLVIFLSQWGGFIKIMSIAGSLTFGLSGIITVLMYWRAKKKGDRKPEFSLPKFKVLGALLILMFAVGIGYMIWEIIK